LPPKLAIQLSLVGLIAVVVLIGGQLVHQPVTYSTDPVTAGVATNRVPAAVPQFQLFDGQFRFDLDKVPLIGPLHAPHVMVSLFDYTCHHCREMHTPITEAQRRFSNQLAVISLPMPLDGKCNPLVKRPMSAHTNACALARLGLTVWRAKPSAAAQFDDWVFGPPNPPLPAAATNYARRLVGTNAFDLALTNQWIDEQIRQDVAIYAEIYRRYNKGAMPEVIIGTNIISGVFTPDVLARMLAEQFGLGAAPRVDKQ
jgi:protein-disulfide isomerase